MTQHTHKKEEDNPYKKIVLWIGGTVLGTLTVSIVSVVFMSAQPPACKRDKDELDRQMIELSKKVDKYIVRSEKREIIDSIHTVEANQSLFQIKKYLGIDE